MKITIYTEKGDKRFTRELKNEATITSVLQQLKINPVTVVTSINGKITISETKLKNNDRLEIFEVVSGG